MEHLRITVEGKVYEVVVEKIDGDETDTQAAPAARSAVRSAAPAAVASTAALAPAPSATPGDVLSPLAGIVQAVEVAVGASVNEGDLIVTLEAMKMYTPVNATSSGTIKTIHVKAGDAVEEGQPLCTIG